MEKLTVVERNLQPAIITPEEIVAGDRLVIRTASGSAYIFESGLTSEGLSEYQPDASNGTLYRANYDKTVTRDNIDTSLAWRQVADESLFADVKIVTPLVTGEQAIFHCNDQTKKWKTTPITSLDIVPQDVELDLKRLVFKRDSLKSRLLGRLSFRNS